MSFARTLGELRQSPFTAQRLGARGVKDELRENLMSRLREGGPIFSGIVGYDDTVVPQIVNAILSRHNFILLGLRGQAKSRILRALTALLDPQMPYIGGCEIHDNPYAPICRRCRELDAKEGDATPISWLAPELFYVAVLGRQPGNRCGVSFFRDQLAAAAANRGIRIIVDLAAPDIRHLGIKECGQRP